MTTQRNFDQGGCVNDTARVGSYPEGASPYDVMDMVGNVSEWINDWYDGLYYTISPNSNPQEPTKGSGRVIRGGGWSYCATIVDASPSGSPGICLPNGPTAWGFAAPVRPEAVLLSMRSNRHDKRVHSFPMRLVYNETVGAQHAAPLPQPNDTQ
jgi:hypothetical protein